MMEMADSQRIVVCSEEEFLLDVSKWSVECKGSEIGAMIVEV